MAAFVERDRCPLCGAGALKTLRSVDFAHPTVWTFLEQRYEGRLRQREVAGRAHEVASCALCGLSFHRYVLSDGALERLYEEWLPANASTEPRPTDLDALIGHTRGSAERTRVLDLAAGSGDWSLAARARGYDVIAVESSDARRKHLRELGLDAVASLEDVPRASIDYAHCDGIFEHLLRPVETLRTLAARLAPSGVARVRVPDATTATRSAAREYWTASDDALRPLEHVNGFTPRALRALGRAAELDEARRLERSQRHRFARPRRNATLAIEFSAAVD